MASTLSIHPDPDDDDMGRKQDKTKSKSGKKQKKAKGTMAERADKFACYLASVQSPEHEIEFFEDVYKEEFGRKPLTLQEDFCGTFSVCCEWVKSSKKRTAVGVDLCPETLQWGRDNVLTRLKDSQKVRVSLLEQDVRKKNDTRCDILAAQNFSFWIFKTRAEVVEYFKCALANMNDESLMIMDMMGGGECYDLGHIDKRRIKKGKNGFKYLWEQAHYNPVNHDCSFFIHFVFDDGSRLNRAFEYHWRFWTIPEVREMLEEAGFSNSYVYWEIEDKKGRDTGEWERNEEAMPHPSWLAYIVAVK